MKWKTKNVKFEIGDIVLLALIGAIVVIVWVALGFDVSLLLKLLSHIR